VDGTVACANCHQPDKGFSDPRPFSIGVRGQKGDRHAMPITAVAFQTFTLWDGRGDSVWIQPLKAIENPKEMDLTRVELVRRVAQRYPEAYAAVFGPLPSLQGLPQRGKPGLPEWDKLPASTRDAVDRVGANVGKALEAYERTILCDNTRFDRWAAGEISLSDREMDGAQVFVDQGCNGCHNGPAFSDGKFHNIGIPSSDPGRSVGRELLLADVFNGAGPLSDDADAGLAKLTAVASESGTLGAFRTASLRGVGQRTFFGHASHQQTLRGFIQDVYRGRGRGGPGGGGPGGGGPGGGGRGATIGQLDPLMNRVNVNGRDVDDLVSFLHTLDCPAPSAQSLAP
jgi:cytochrome c peroxidase